MEDNKEMKQPYVYGVEKTESLKITQVELTNEDNKKFYDDIVREMTEQNKRALTKEREAIVTASATQSVILNALKTKNFLFDDEFADGNVKNYDVYIPITVVGYLRHPVLIKQVYKNQHKDNVYYTYDVQWYDEYRHELRTDTWTTSIRSAEMCHCYSGDTVVPYEIAKKYTELHADSLTTEVKERFEESAFYYYTGKDDIAGEIEGYNEGDLISAYTLKELDASSHLVIPAPTYLNMYLNIMNGKHNKVKFTVGCSDSNDNKEGQYYINLVYGPVGKLITEDDCYFKHYETFEKAVISMIDALAELDMLHPYYIYEDEYTNSIAQRLYDEGLWSDEECELYANFSPYVDQNYDANEVDFDNVENND